MCYLLAKNPVVVSLHEYVLLVNPVLEMCTVPGAIFIL